MSPLSGTGRHPFRENLDEQFLPFDGRVLAGNMMRSASHSLSISVSVRVDSESVLQRRTARR